MKKNPQYETLIEGRLINLALKKSEAIQLANINRIFDNNAYKLAQRYRYEVLNDAVDTFRSNPEIVDDVVTGGMLSSVLKRRPWANTYEILSTNVLVTRYACIKCLEDEATNTIEKIATFSCISELGGRDFILPTGKKKVSHLAAAKESGYFFTPASVAIRMVLLGIAHQPNAINCMDPSCGAGIFLALHMVISNSTEHYLGIELDEETANLARILLAYLKERTSREVTFDVSHLDYYDFISKKKRPRFDLILMNPPYGSIKFLASDLTDSTTEAKLTPTESNELAQSLRSEISDKTHNLRKLFKNMHEIGKGQLEHSRLFLASSFNLLDGNGTLVAITSSSWLGDASSCAFRSFLLDAGLVSDIWFFPESAKLFKRVNQPTAVVCLRKEHQDEVLVSRDNLNASDILSGSELVDSKSLFSSCELKGRIATYPPSMYSILRKLSSNARLKSIPNLINKRGELDLTFGKSLIQKTGQTRLIRGDHIDGMVLLDANCSKKEGYIDFDKFARTSPKSGKNRYCQYRRIAIPQCSYLKKARRIEACLVPEGSVISNSCNFIAYESGNPPRGWLGYYTALLNSSAIEWYFRAYSYNNHVSNIEIDNLPCVPFESLSSELRLAFAELETEPYNSSLSKNMDKEISVLLGLNEEDHETILSTINTRLY